MPNASVELVQRWLIRDCLPTVRDSAKASVLRLGIAVQKWLGRSVMTSSSFARRQLAS